MRRVLLALSLVSVPAMVFAVYTHPSELLLRDRPEDRPQDFAVEMHAHADSVYVSAWMRGVSEGADVTTGKGSFRVTVDVADRGETLRAKAQARIVDQTLYLRLDSITGNALDMYGDMARQYADGKWYSLRLDNIQEQHGVDDEEVKQILREVVDVLFTLERTVSGKDSVYSLKLNKDAASDLRALMDTLSKEYPDLGMEALTRKNVAELRKIFSKTNVHVKVTTDGQDLPKAVKFYAAYDDASMGFGFVVSGLTAVRAAPITVLAPMHAISLDGGDTGWKESSALENGSSSAGGRRTYTTRPSRRSLR